MVADTVTVKIDGLAELRTALEGLAPKIKAKVLLAALRKGARPVRDAIRQRTPVLRTTTYSGASAIKRGVRKPGTLRKAIKVRTSKRDKMDGNVGVFINVKPAKGARYKSVPIRVLGIKSRIKTRKLVRASQRGAKSPNDPYYWRWVNFGTRYKPGAHMFETGAAASFREAVAEISASLGPAIQRYNTPGGAR